MFLSSSGGRSSRIESFKEVLVLTVVWSYVSSYRDRSASSIVQVIVVDADDSLLVFLRSGVVVWYGDVMANRCFCRNPPAAPPLTALVLCDDGNNRDRLRNEDNGVDSVDLGLVCSLFQDKVFDAEKKEFHLEWFAGFCVVVAAAALQPLSRAVSSWSLIASAFISK